MAQPTVCCFRGIAGLRVSVGLNSGAEVDYLLLVLPFFHMQEKGQEEDMSLSNQPLQLLRMHLVLSRAGFTCIDKANNGIRGIGLTSSQRDSSFNGKNISQLERRNAILK